MIDNVWSIAVERADEAGVELARVSWEQIKVFVMAWKDYIIDDL